MTSNGYYILRKPFIVVPNQGNWSVSSAFIVQEKGSREWGLGLGTREWRLEIGGQELGIGGQVLGIWG